MIAWPACCSRCEEPIEDWGAAGSYQGGFMHKRCWSELNGEAHAKGRRLPELRSPLEKGSQLEGPMFVFLMMFHFGLATAVAGWFLLTQTDQDRTLGLAVLIPGLIVPLIGAAGAAINILSRRRIELIRHQLDLSGGWKPGR
jgi:hypothetical protein